jgi:ornithine cyclodeaminase/alanine dehydrogenase-like protein (mu-crystallin family)
VKHVRLIRDCDVQQILTPERAISVLREGFRRHYTTTTELPARSQLDYSTGVLLTMPCYDSALGRFGVKLVTVADAATDAGRVQAVYLVFDARSGQALAIIEANFLTDLRTAAMSAIVTDSLALPTATTLGIFGTGRQARAHLRVLRGIRPFSRVLVSGSSERAASQFAREMQQQSGLLVQACDAEQCARESDVICTCTTATQPLFDGSTVRAGTHLNLVGAFRPDAREVGEALIRRSKIVVDTFEGAMAEAGDLLVPIKMGHFKSEQISADVHRLVTGEAHVRTSEDDVTVFKSVGSAYEDLIVASEIYDRISCP